MSKHKKTEFHDRGNTAGREASRALLILWTAAALGCAASTDVEQVAPQPRRPPRVVLLIGDGIGIGHWTAALAAADDLAVRRLAVIGLVDTRSSDSRVTDSAAGATAYATGIRTYNGAIGVGPDSLPHTTVLEAAAQRGMATGLVATSRITHATPAAFVAHVPSRSSEWEIARQLVDAGVTVVMGGGRRLFEPGARPDSIDLLDRIRRRYSYIETADELTRLSLDSVSAVFGLFAPSDPPPAASRRPTLRAMTEAALAVLHRDPDGFFLMVEGSQADWQSHDQAPLDQVIAEVLDFDQAVAAVVDYRRRHPETVIVVAADHETGGLALQVDSTGTPVATYATGKHSGNLVPLFADGPGTERLGAILAIEQVGQFLMQAVRR